MAARKSSLSAPRKISPGLVQNCPEPRVTESNKAPPISLPRSESAAAVTKIGFKLPISAKTGIGVLREWLRSTKSFPTSAEPVNPIALTFSSRAIQ